jgi:hypothetical protein
MRHIAMSVTYDHASCLEDATERVPPTATRWEIAFDGTGPPDPWIILVSIFRVFRSKYGYKDCA